LGFTIANRILSNLKAHLRKWLKMEKIYTRHHARKYAKDNRIEEWIHEFINNEGNNVAFSEGLKIEKRIFIGPIIMPLDLFNRICGPEEDNKYIIDNKSFDERISRISTRLQSGWDMPPLIINFANNVFELTDGNHRYEALVRRGIMEWDIIIWITGEDDYDQFLISYGGYLKN
jgi:hypothetical protein